MSREVHRVRTSHYDRIDQEASTRIMTREWRTATPRQDAPAVVQEGGETPAVVHARLARDAVVPDALALSCRAHHAEPSVPCWRSMRAVCPDRIARSRQHAS